jgi:hypothetical protein
MQGRDGTAAERRRAAGREGTRGAGVGSGRPEEDMAPRERRGCSGGIEDRQGPGLRVERFCSIVSEDLGSSTGQVREIRGMGKGYQLRDLAYSLGWFIAGFYRAHACETFQVHVYFRGPLNWGSSRRALRLDVTRDQLLTAPAEPRHLIHPYSDAEVLQGTPNLRNGQAIINLRLPSAGPDASRRRLA